MPPEAQPWYITYMIEKYLNIIGQSYTGYWNYLWHEITQPQWHSYFYVLILVSLIFFMLEKYRPWRRDQALIRLDFWLDGFYMFFNFFLVQLLMLVALFNVVFAGLNDLLVSAGIGSLEILSFSSLPGWVPLVLYFVVRDFIQWNIHRLLHRVERLWQFHKVHHSVKQMGFAAQLRYQWVENIVYRLLEYIPLSLLGLEFGDFFIVHCIALTIGHFNHANFTMPLGPLKYIFNNPEMHIWHHAREMPFAYGCNFGLSLSIWDYLFKTAYIPQNGRDVELGFPGDETFPKGFMGQVVYPMNKNHPSA